MSVKQYLDWVEEVEHKGEMYSYRRFEYGHVPTKAKRSPLVTFLVDPSNESLKQLLINDAYDLSNEQMNSVISRKFFD